MNKEELLEAIEQKRQEIWPTDTGEMKPATVPNNLESGWLNALTWMKRYINSFPAEQPSEELEEAANKYADDNPSLCLENDGGIYEDFAAPRRNFIAGANWQKQQMMKSAIDAIITLRWKDSHVCLTTNKDISQIYNGDRVKIIIIREDEQ